MILSFFFYIRMWYPSERVYVPVKVLKRCRLGFQVSVLQLSRDIMNYMFGIRLPNKSAYYSCSASGCNHTIDSVIKGTGVQLFVSALCGSDENALVADNMALRAGARSIRVANIIKCDRTVVLPGHYMSL